jgi:hypothetical protein
MQKQRESLEKTWERIDRHIRENPILILLAEENAIHDIDYGRYLRHGYTQDDVSTGFELIHIYRQLKTLIRK